MDRIRTHWRSGNANVIPYQICRLLLGWLPCGLIDGTCSMGGRGSLKFGFFLDYCERHIIITTAAAIVQRRRIRHRAVHNPSLRFIFGTDKVVDFSVSMSAKDVQFKSRPRNRSNSRFRRNMPGRQFRLPEPICKSTVSIPPVDRDERKGRKDTYLLALALPQFTTPCNCSSVQASRSTDLTLLIWVPILLWTPEQRIQMKTPMFQEAHRGSSQSEQRIHQHLAVFQMKGRLGERSRRPPTFIALAIGTDLIAVEFQETPDYLLVLCSLRRSRTPRHVEEGVMVSGRELAVVSV